MNQYIEDTAIAVRGLLSLIGDDESIFRAKQIELESTLERKRRAKAILYYGVPMTGSGEDATPYYEKKVRDARRVIIELKDSIESLEAVILAKEISVQALAGAILQIAKQGISIVGGNPANCPAGRSIGRENLKNVIWQARNQSMHWEVNSFYSPVQTCFENLYLDFGADYQLHSSSPKSLAKQILHLLKWTSYESYESDMLSLLG